MIRLSASILVAASVLLSACTEETRTPAQIQMAEVNANKTDDIWKSRRPVTVGGDRYEVGVSEFKKFALVGFRKVNLGVTQREVEAAARAVSGCAADASRPLARLSNGDVDTVIPLEKLGSAAYLRVELSC
ncbi:hypothetical protein [Actibacterium lipolyticum]|uniref:Lipoprotein n=1 Tax=Actibacterium lipolyticum TaxID=1524263 RepID=A0A238JUN8_9RHOB|nr:hypothetical protein [Actibacterium lipolyticum]SMX33904.1 hypothetical protein COL8621_01122 [Actibacterium lipolyticum]